MPSFMKNGDFHIVSFVTGPWHVRLGICFGEDPVAEPTTEQLPAIGSCHHGELDSGSIVAAVMEGAGQANEKLDCGFFPARIQFVANDSPNYEVYAHSAYLLVQALHEGTEFVPLRGEETDDEGVDSASRSSDPKNTEAESDPDSGK